MIVEQTIWKYEPEKQTLIFISQTGHGKPMVAAYSDVSTKGAAKLKDEIDFDNSLWRVFTAHQDYISFVIYKAHYNTKDNEAAIQTAFNHARQVYPDKIFKISKSNNNIYETLKDKPNVEFYTRWEGPVSDDEA